MPSGFPAGVLCTVRSPAEKPWLECGVVGNAMPCNRDRYKTLVKHLMLLPILKIGDMFTIVLLGWWLWQFRRVCKVGV
jgi:hypothetical protein